MKHDLPPNTASARAVDWLAAQTAKADKDFGFVCSSAQMVEALSLTCLPYELGTWLKPALDRGLIVKGKDPMDGRRATWRLGDGVPLKETRDVDADNPVVQRVVLAAEAARPPAVATLPIPTLTKSAAREAIAATEPPASTPAPAPAPDPWPTPDDLLFFAGQTDDGRLVIVDGERRAVFSREQSRAIARACYGLT